MPYKLEVNHPDFPKGFPFDCDGIPVENGSTATVTKEQELQFIGKWGRDIKHFYGHGAVAKVTGSSELTPKERKEALPDEDAFEIELPENNDDAKDGGE